MDSADPKSFKETDLFKQCRERGIIPGSETDSASKASALAVGLERDADHFIATEILIQAHKKNIAETKEPGWPW